MKNIFRLIRWQNLLMLAVVMWLVGHTIVLPILEKATFVALLPWYVEYMLILSATFIAAGGYAINDYFDTKIDAINRPDRQVINNGIDKPTAMFVHQALTIIGVILGLVVALLVRSWTVALIILFTPGLLWFYSASYKRQFIIGNMMVALVCALCPLLIAVANAAAFRYQFEVIVPYTTIIKDIYTQVGVFSAFAFLFTLIREIIKDLEDQVGDREMECHTLPVVIGEMWTKVVVTLLIILSIAALAHVYFVFLDGTLSWSSRTLRYMLIGLVLPLLCDLVLLWTSKLPSDYRHVQVLMKVIMLIGMFLPLVINI